MRGKRIAALTIAFLMILCQIPNSVIYAFAAETDYIYYNKSDNTDTDKTDSDTDKITELTLPDDFSESITVEPKVYDGTPDTDIIIDDVTFNEQITDRISLSAKARFEDEYAGEKKTVTVYDFALTGENSDKYKLKLKNNQKSVTLYDAAAITPRPIYLIPKDSIVRGEQTPKKIDYDWDQSDIVGDDYTEITAELYIDSDSEGEFVYIISDIYATGNSNYMLAIKDNAKPVELEPNAPVITDARVEKDGAEHLTQYDFGIVADGDVALYVTAKTKEKIDVDFILSSGHKVKVSDCTEYYEQDNTISYIYTAKFRINITNASSLKIDKFECVANNGTASENTLLQLYTDHASKTVTTLILDQEPVHIDVMNVNYNNDIKLFSAEGMLYDEDSGIKSIRYKWDNQKEWVEYHGNFSNEPGVGVEFKSDTVNYGAYYLNREEGMHTLYFELEDNAGNISGESGTYCNSSDGPDEAAPEVTYINMRANKSALHTILTILTLGNYSKEELIIGVKARDVSYSDHISGVKKVMLLGNKIDDTDNTDIDDSDNIVDLYEFRSELDGVADKNHLYEFKLTEEQSIDDLSVYLGDNYGNYDVLSVSELLKSDLSSDIDNKVKKEDLSTDIWVLDFTKPEITFNYSDAVGGDDLYYFNDTYQNKISVNVKDENAVRRVIIKEQYREKPGDKSTDSIIIDKTYSADEEIYYHNKEYNFDINDSYDKKTGWYNYCVTAYDFAENDTDLISELIYIDHEMPEGEIKVESIDTAEENGVTWVREKDDDNNYNDITLRLYAAAVGAQIDTLNVEICADNKTELSESFRSFNVDEEGKQYVDVVISNDKNRSNYVPLGSDNTYEIKTTVISVSRNRSNARIILHVDTENPEINRFTVEKKNSAAETILNVLTFGVFANDSLRLKVEVKDGRNDIGIDKVEISYDGLEESKLMTPDEPFRKGDYEVYYYDLELGTQVFQSNIVVTVYDKIGKKNLSCTNISNTDDEHGEADNCFVMIENIKPVMTADLPLADYVDKENGKIWYRAHNETEDYAMKILEFSLQDENSGIRAVKMIVNDTDITLAASNAEIDGQSLPTIESTLETGKEDREKLCEVFTFRYSLDLLADIVPPKEDGSYVIQFEAVDNAGNVSVSPVDKNGDPYEEEKIVLYRDIQQPYVSGFTLEPQSYDGISSITDYIEELEYGYYFKDDFVLTIKAEDNEPSSGLKYAELRLVSYNKDEITNIETYDLPMSEGENSIEILKGFKGRIYGTVYDNVINSSQEVSPKAYVIDDDKPEIELELIPRNSTNKDNSGNMLFTGDVDIKVTVTDEKSGLRSITYSKKSENGIGSNGDVITEIDNLAGYEQGAVINGWEITESDVNLVTKMTRVFRFGGTNSEGDFDFYGDDNDIQMHFSAMDRSGNEADIVSSSVFTIDTIAPVMTVKYSDPINDMYYSSDVKFTITITERNFDWESCYKQSVGNSFTDAYPNVVYSDSGNVHTAEYTFTEGDYTFSAEAQDLGGHRAVAGDGVSSGSFRDVFNVDKTKPIITTNFSEFGEDNNTELYYNFDTDVVITVEEHNFDSRDLNVVVKEKRAGSIHTNANNEETGEVWYDKTFFDWKTVSGSSDKHSLTIPLSQDGVYLVELKQPKDRAQNSGEFTDMLDHTAIFEIDKTAPELSVQNGVSYHDDSFISEKYYDVYDETRKEEAPPSVDFSDINFDRIEIEYLIYTPTYKNQDGKEINTIEPTANVYGASKEVIRESHYDLPKDLFVKDGVYIYKFVALDKAGNPSKEIENTYFRMINTDVLAYIENSSISDQSGNYSLMHEDGTSISKKSVSFSDLSICVIKLDDDIEKGKLAVRRDEVNYYPGEYAGYKETYDKLSATSKLIRMDLPRDYFAEAFKDDQMDARMYLSVSVRDGVYFDLAQIHIDNVPPSATLPKEFKSWHNIFTKDGVTITLTDISETLDDKKSGVYECPGNGSRGNALSYDYEASDRTFSFDLKNGMHHIEVSLVDEAGNEWNVERVKYLTVGNYLIYILIGLVVVAGGVTGFVIFRKKRA